MKAFHSLRYRIALTIFLLEVLMVSFTLWQTLDYTERSLRLEAEHNEEGMLNLLADLSKNALFSVEYDEMQEHVNTIVINNRIETVHILDENDNIIISSDFSMVGEKSSKHIPNGSSFWKMRKLDDMGKLYVLFSIDEIEKAIDKARNLGMVIALTGMLFIAIVSLIIGNVLTRRLDLLIKAVSDFSKGDLSVSTQIEGKDEVSILGNSFEKMRLLLHEQIDDLQEARESLELRVQERTLQLEENEKKLIVLNEELEAKVEKELNLRRLQDQYLIEEEQVASLGRMVSGIAHEINTPLGNALLGVSQMHSDIKSMSEKFVEEKVKKSDFEEFLSTAKELSRIVEYSLSNAAKLVKSFKTIAVEQTHEALHRFELRAYFNDILRSMDNQLKGKNILIDLQCEEGLYIESYPGFYSQIFTNLINNSLLHGFEGYDEGNIIINIHQIGNRLHISYKDNGKGIKEEDRTHIFEAFYTTKKDDGGTGQGMYIVLKIIHEKLNGSIELQANKDKGIEFIINIQADMKDL